MALPTILINSATGSDSLASGAGPATALTGSSASTDGTGLIVTLDGSPDLTNVAVDGSHVIYLADATAGARNFGKITAKDAGAFTVTVANAFGLSVSGKAWAIGGKRASIGSTTSIKLFSNNSAAGDAMPGWVVEMESGHAETLAATLVFRRSGDTTDGPLTLRGTAGAATLPCLTFSHNGNALSGGAGGANLVVLRDFELRNTNATKTASVGINTGNMSPCLVVNIRINHSTDKFWKGIVLAANGGTARLCEVAYTASHGIEATGLCEKVAECYTHHCGGSGINFTGDINTGVVRGNLCVLNTGDGITLNHTSTTSNRSLLVNGNTCDSNTGDGLEIANTGGLNGAEFQNNLLSNNGGYGLNFSSGSLTAALLAAYGAVVDRNNTYNNTSGDYSLSGVATNDPGLDPQYTNAAGGDYRIGTNLQAAGYPNPNIGTGSATRSYVDPGAAQRQEAGGGIGALVGGSLIR